MKNTDDEDRAFRGGSWHNPAWNCRAYTIDPEARPGYRDGGIGFRVLRRRKP
jgi:formylglycine-generating enzyme required for sulfatase activity